ncbi:MAG: hypothetical protein QG644_90 [Patescibacteria group bacterium]|nr:hypothetical protein [Patescibacteria group bacterium]
MKWIFFILSSFILGACAKEYSCENCQPVLQPKGSKFVIAYNGPFRMFQGGETPNILKLKRSLTDSVVAYTLCNVYPGHWPDSVYGVGKFYQFMDTQYLVMEHNFYYAFSSMEPIPVVWFKGDRGIDSVTFLVNYDTSWRTKYPDNHMLILK